MRRTHCAGKLRNHQPAGGHDSVDDKQTHQGCVQLTKKILHSPPPPRPHAPPHTHTPCLTPRRTTWPCRQEAGRSDRRLPPRIARGTPTRDGATAAFHRLCTTITAAAVLTACAPPSPPLPVAARRCPSLPRRSPLACLSQAMPRHGDRVGPVSHRRRPPPPPLPHDASRQNVVAGRFGLGEQRWPKRRRRGISS